jgi:hypothetical protein
VNPLRLRGQLLPVRHQLLVVGEEKVIAEVMAPFLFGVVILASTGALSLCVYCDCATTSRLPAGTVSATATIAVGAANGSAELSTWVDPPKAAKA